MNQGRRNAIITGGASGLGRALAVRLGQDGWHVAIADRDLTGSEETLRLVVQAGGTAQVEPLDVSSLTDWAALQDRLASQWSTLDLLVNNAGVAGCGTLGEFPIQDWHWLLGVNLHGTIYGCHTFVEWLKKSPGSGILNTASFAAMAPSPFMAAYNVAKSGIVALSETLYGELKPVGVSVTVLCPMFFRTRIQHGARSHDQATNEYLVKNIENASLTAEHVASAAIRAVYKRQLYAVPGVQARFVWWLRRMLPQAVLTMIGNDVHRQREKLTAQAS